MKSFQFIEIVGIFIFAWVLLITILFFISMDDMKRKCNMESRTKMSLRDLIIYTIVTLFIYIIIAILYNTYDTPVYKQYQIVTKGMKK